MVAQTYCSFVHLKSHFWDRPTLALGSFPAGDEGGDELVYEQRFRQSQQFNFLIFPIVSVSWFFWVSLLQILAIPLKFSQPQRNPTMGRRRDKMLHGAVVGMGQDVSNAALAFFRLVSGSFRPSQTVEEHPSGPRETTVEVSDGSSVANPITSETADYGTPASQADEFSMEIAMPVEEFLETADYASQADELPPETVMPAEEFSGVTVAQVKAVVDEGLIDQPTPRRTNPTTVIHPKINMEYAIQYRGTVLYEKQRGQWVAEPLPEKIAERVAPTVPTFPYNGVLDFRRIALA